jgi:hypothetical protein
MLSPTSSTASPGEPEPLDQAAQRKATIVTVLLLLVAAITCVVLWRWSRNDEASAIRTLPMSDRRSLFEGTLRTLESVCDPQTRPPGLDGYCNEQAIFVRQFPECEAACLALAKGARRPPTR